LPFIVEVVHVSRVSLAVSVRRSEPPDGTLKSKTVFAGHFCADGQGSTVVEQSAVAEALPAPGIAVRAAAATAARPSIFRYLITLLVP
jgi:hypothetical protein